MRALSGRKNGLICSVGKSMDLSGIGIVTSAMKELDNIFK